MISKIYNDDALNVLKNIEDESIDLIVSDIPYKIVAGGVTVKKIYNETGGILNKRYIADGSKISLSWLKANGRAPAAIREGKMFDYNDIKFKEWLPDAYRVLKKGTHCYLMINARNMKELIDESEKAGFVFQNILVWDKGNCVPNKYYMNAVEFILMLSKRPARNINDMGSKNIIRIPNILNGKKLHPTEKPMALMEHFISNSSNEGDIVLDPFAGAGSTLLAAKKLNREYIGVEIDKKFYDIIIDRLGGNNNTLFDVS